MTQAATPGTAALSCELRDVLGQLAQKQKPVWSENAVPSISPGRKPLCSLLRASEEVTFPRAWLGKGEFQGGASEVS